MGKIVDFIYTFIGVIVNALAFVLLLPLLLAALISKNSCLVELWVSSYIKAVSVLTFKKVKEEDIWDDIHKNKYM